MPRYIMNAMVSIEVITEDDDDARDMLSSGLDLGRFYNTTIHTLETKEVAYSAPPGADLWAQSAKNVDFDNDDDGRQKMGGVYDGSWWWTNGHVMLRCEGSIPEGWREIPAGKFEDAFALAHARKPTDWSEELEAPDSDLLGRYALANPSANVQWKYFDLVADAVPGCYWMVADDPTAPIHAFDSLGRLVAVVAPMLPNTLVALKVAS